MGARFGAFGKMPSLGDFLRMDLPSGFIDPWDRWLQEGILSVRASLGEAWQDCYFSAPIWRFNLSPGLAGAAAVMGVMMSSVEEVDSVARCIEMGAEDYLFKPVNPVLLKARIARAWRRSDSGTSSASWSGSSRPPRWRRSWRSARPRRRSAICARSLPSAHRCSRGGATAWAA
ncbi:MAG: type VI secretion system-associated protein TagF [Aquincola sp.]|nr:type VI secretion system-associated protein TagF [Aquincola sp.]